MTDSRFAIREWPEVPPSRCMICGASHRRDGRKYIDFGLNISRYGAVYFCTACIGEAATMIGYLSPDVARELERDWNAKTVVVEGYKDENGRLRRALAELDFLGNIRDALSVVDEQQNSGATNIPGSDNESVDIAKRSAEPEQGSVESDNGGGSSVVSSDDSLDDILSSI